MNPEPVLTENKSSYDTNRLKEESVSHEALISRIKKEVADDYDNISKPIPLFFQLEHLPA